MEMEGYEVPDEWPADPAERGRLAAFLERVAAHPERHNEVPVMPAHGLVLEEVGYPPDDLLASRAAEARAVRTLDDLRQERA